MLSARVVRRVLIQAAPLIKQSRSFTRISVRATQLGYLSTVNRFRSVNDVQRIAVRSFAVSTENLESLGDSISTAVVLSWNKEAGESVKESDVIAVVETDKVTMDIRAKKGGVFVEGLIPVKGEATVGHPFYKIDTDASAAEGKKEQKQEAAPVEKKAEAKEESKPAKESSAPAGGKKEEVMVNVPVMGESITSGTVGKWFAKVGDQVSADQVVAQIDTDKVNVEVRAPVSGTIVKVFAEEGQEISVATPFFTLAPGEVTAAPAKPAEKKEKPASEAATSQKKPAASEKPSEEKKAAAAPAKAASAPAASSSSASSAFAGDRSETRVKMTRMRQRIAARLKESQNTAAMLTTFQECDMSNLIELRNKFKDDFEKSHGVKLGFMSAFVKACTAALQEIPAVNGVIDDETQEIVYRNYCDISVAVASPTGLVVPVLRNTEKMNFADVEKSIAMYGKKAKDGKLALEDMAGGTFTISNGGVFGSLFGTPIINPPQSAILGMHATKPRAVVINGKVEARPMMYLALTYDHRLIDGREAVTFLKSVAQKIEDPTKLLLSL